jgi:hypothetical protein
MFYEDVLRRTHHTVIDQTLDRNSQYESGVAV